MITFGKGGWTWDDLYFHIPVYLRMFYLAEMAKVIQKENEAMENATDRSRGKIQVTPPPYSRTPPSPTGVK